MAPWLPVMAWWLPCSARVVRPKLEETKSKLPELSDEAMDGSDEQNWRGLPTMVFGSYLLAYVSGIFKTYSHLFLNGLYPYRIFFGFCGYWMVCIK